MTSGCAVTIRNDLSAIRFCHIRCVRFVGYAAIWFGLVGSTPFLELTPLMTLARQSNPRNRLQFCAAHWPGINIMCSLPSRDRQPFKCVVCYPEQSDLAVSAAEGLLFAFAQCGNCPVTILDGVADNARRWTSTQKSHDPTLG